LPLGLGGQVDARHLGHSPDVASGRIAVTNYSERQHGDPDVEVRFDHEDQTVTGPTRSPALSSPSEFRRPRVGEPRYPRRHRAIARDVGADSPGSLLRR
jgi:hypothetical protein